jgi:DNA translocase FtsK/SpoIIIE-like protein
MSENTRSGHNLGHDILGVVLFAFGGFLGVSVVTYLVTGSYDPTSLTAFVVDLVAMFGSSPVLWLCAGLVFIGVRLFLSGVSGGLGRDIAGFFVTALGLSILLGVFSRSLGGSFGVATGGAAADLLTPAGGAVLGIGALVGPAWFLWLRTSSLARRTGLAGDQEAPLPGDLAPEADEAADSIADGVTAEEARALLSRPEAETPSESETDGTQEVAGAIGGTWATWGPEEPVAKASPPPYPVDVRKYGGVPEGARPIEPDHAQRQSQSPAEARAVRRWSPPASGSPELGARSHLAPEEDPQDRAGAPAGQRGPAAEPARPQTLAIPPRRTPQSSAATPILPVALGSSAAATAPIAEVSAEPAAEVSRAEEVHPIPSAEVGASPPAPSWEQPGLFEPPEEPVDAYGTPLSLVMALREESDAAPGAAADAAPDSLEDAAEESPEGSLFFGSEAAPALEEEAEESAVEAQEDDTDAALEEELAASELGQADEAGASDEADERQVVITPVQHSLLDDDEAPVPKQKPRPGKASKRKKGAAPKVEEPAADSPDVDDLAVERRVMPETPESGAVGGSAEDLLHRAGNLILERKRVAVSMLQREFELDFKEATELLDQLQNAGLIGPYLGGQRRDILLTTEQWQERIGAR